MGCFEPRKPLINNLEDFEGKGIEYIIKDPELYKGKKISIFGGGDSALDWAIYFAKTASQVTLVHRRSSFRGHLDSVETVNKLAKNGKINLITEAEVNKIVGNDTLQSIKIKNNTGDETNVITDFWFPLFGLVPKLGPIKDYATELDKNAIKVDTLDYSTNISGVYAIGDVNTYQGKLKLILCGFHEGQLWHNLLLKGFS